MPNLEKMDSLKECSHQRFQSEEKIVDREEEKPPDSKKSNLKKAIGFEFLRKEAMSLDAVLERRSKDM
jgi:hypothetical protein